MSAHVVVIGSLNIDLVVVADRLPRPGETVLGGQFATHEGGKGANQAVAAARAGAGARVSMIGAVGTDAHSERALAALMAEQDAAGTGATYLGSTSPACDASRTS
ncbi:MAG: PfkB family carbohydrate kinase [Candidatus Limnocylindria bacterium]